jgi:predicted RNA-binding Zn-ribbon protein involved in translation (DUF1610 family)
MPDLFTDVRCRSCGQSHTFRDHGVRRHPIGSEYSFTCPATGQVSTFRSPVAESVILCPAGTIPARWVAD